MICTRDEHSRERVIIHTMVCPEDLRYVVIPDEH